MNIRLVFLIIYCFAIDMALADLNIINNGEVLESKPYSMNEATLIVNKSEKIYICSVSNNLTKCVLSKKKIKVN